MKYSDILKFGAGAGFVAFAAAYVLFGWLRVPPDFMAKITGAVTMVICMLVEWRYQRRNRKFRIDIVRDSDGDYFIYESDLNGLHAEAKSLDELVKVCDELAPDLIKANHRDCRRAWLNYRYTFDIREV